MGTFFLKEMKLGAASAATQIEGGAVEHSWSDWAKKGHIKDGSDPARACDHYNRWLEDDQLMVSLGLQTARIGVEWARVEPQEGVFDEQAIAHYVEEAKWLQDHGILPLVTLHHFTTPLWFEKDGAFEHIENVTRFLLFVEKMVMAYGDTVTEYITINEPNVYATNGYFFGLWPPGEHNLGQTLHVMSVLAAAHVRAYRLIHDLQAKMGIPETRVGFALHMRIFEPKNHFSPYQRTTATTMERFFQGSLARALCTGAFSFPLKNIGNISRGDYCDFWGLNYYTRTTVTGFKDGVRSGAQVNDLGWEICPEGIVACALKLFDIKPLPIYITENGTCDNTDSFRSRYLYEHLKELCLCSLPVERYYHWCFTDNFEWIEGESARFGLVNINYETQERTIKNSGYFYRDMITANGVTEELFKKYVKDQRYHTNE